MAEPIAALRSTLDAKLATQIDEREIELGEAIGSGTFGTVYRGVCRGHRVAVKVLHKSMNEEEINELAAEISIMREMSHPNIVRYMGCCVNSKNEIMVITEYMAEGDLHSVTTKYKLSLLVRLRMARDAALGIAWLHQHDPMIVHRDIKSGNLLVSDDLRVVVCDFGLSDVVRRNTETYDSQGAWKGTPLFLAPEVIRGVWFNEKVDTYSFGLVLWELISGQTLKTSLGWGKWTPAELKKYVCFEDVRPPVDEATLGAATPRSLAALMKDLWADDAAERPAMKDVVTRLNRIIAETAIHDADGFAFWTECLLGDERIKWVRFWRVLHSFMMRLHPKSSYIANLESDQPDQIRVLRKLLNAEDSGDGTPGQVSVEQFGRVLAWFSPQPLSHEFWLRDALELARQPWFHGDISTDEAASLLVGQPAGTFLVRFSASTLGDYVISASGGEGSRVDQVQHLKLAHPPGSTRFCASGDISAPSIMAFVKEHGERYKLLRPCSGSKYAIFAPGRRLSIDAGAYQADLGNM